MHNEPPARAAQPNQGREPCDPDLSTSESRYINWNPEHDICNIRPSAVRLRNLSARQQKQRLLLPFMSQSGRSDLVFWRRQALRRMERVIAQPISGRVLEIGAGGAWFSAEYSRRPDVAEVYAMDYEEFCVQELMPETFRRLRAEQSKITRVLGSFNAMQCDDSFFDFIVALGALHHSEHLSQTFRECRRVLRPGGWLLALERCAYNDLSREEQDRLESKPLPASRIEHLYGKDVPSNERISARDYSNHLFRLFEYEHHAFAAGFQHHSFLFDASPVEGRLTLAWRMLTGAILRDRLLNTHSRTGFSRPVLYPYFARGAFRRRDPVYDRLILLARRPPVTCSIDSSLFDQTSR